MKIGRPRTSTKPRFTGQPTGRPKKNISVDDMLDAYKRLGKWDCVAEELGIGTATIFRRLKELKLKSYRIYEIVS